MDFTTFSASSAVKFFSDLSSFPIQKELDFLRFLFDNGVRLHGADSLLWVVNLLCFKLLQSQKWNLFARPILSPLAKFT